MIQDPVGEVLAAVARAERDEPSTADRRALALARRRFGVALPPPFAPPITDAATVPIRPAVAGDGAAIAAVKWRMYRLAYRGVLPDAFLDQLGFHPGPAWWIDLATHPASTAHRALVAGRRGEVHGGCAVGPNRDGELGTGVGEVCQLYVDPTAAGQGVGQRLLGAGLDVLAAAGCDDVRLWVIAANRGARRFYERQGWEADRTTKRWVLEPEGVVFDEVRYRYGPGLRALA
jgi:GNAT superfamily N-acetyltransferase